MSLHKGIKGFWRLFREIRAERYDIAVILQVSFRVSAAVFLSGIRSRVGPLSKWYSYLFFNRGMRQNRSAVEMHEADYNLMLLRRLGIRVPSRRFIPHTAADPDATERMQQFIESLKMPNPDSFVVVHPGMGGSALNWPEGYYVDLIQRLSQRGVSVMVPGAYSEKALVARVTGEANERDPELPIFSFVSSNRIGSLSDLIAILSLSKVVVAPSTGPLHLAVALGKPTVSFFSPVKVQSALRWGPYTADDSKHSVLVPDALCGQDFKCLGRKCPFFFCMERTGVEEAVRSVMEKL
jgi:ADP-heptose:LPS heptosyltransferase